MAGAWLAVALFVAPACGDCRGLRAGSGTSFARCRAAAPRELRAAKVGALSLAIDDRALVIQGAEPPITIAAFSGPAPGSAPLAEPAIAAVRAANPALTLVLGGLGDEPAAVERNVRALTALPGLVLLLAGTRDHPDHVDAALEAAGPAAAHLIDVTPFEQVRLGATQLIPLAGARDGASAPDDARCGYDLEDLKTLAAHLGPAPEGTQRLLLAAEAPSGEGPFSVARTDRGVDLGSADLAELSHRIGAPGGLFAGPHPQVLRPSVQAGARRAALGEAAPDLRLVVPRLGGPAIERSDGSRVGPAFAVLTLTSSGLRLDAAAELP